MAATTMWCVFGALILTCSLVAGSDTSTPTDSKCERFVIGSTPTNPTKQLIPDNYGRPANIILVTIVRTFSDIKCVLGDSVVVDEPYITVSKGCQVQVEVCFKVFIGPEPTVRPGCMLIRLLSRLNRPVDETLTTNIRSMSVVRQFAEGALCEEEVNFGFSGKTIFAKDGCRADFEVCLTDYKPPKDLVCELYVLTSTKNVPDERRILGPKGGIVAVFSVVLLKNISTTVKCVKELNYFYNDTFVVAKSGCAGRFNVCYVPTGPDPGTTLPSGCITVRLLSTFNNSVRKKILDDNVIGRSMEVQKQFSDINCILNKNFGFEDNYFVYASGGCRADFLVCVTSTNPVTESPKYTCVNVLLASWGPNEPDVKRVTGRGGAAIIIKSIRLVRQDSVDPCLSWRRHYYYEEPDKVYATQGCQGTFRVCYDYIRT